MKIPPSCWYGSLLTKTPVFRSFYTYSLPEPPVYILIEPGDLEVFQDALGVFVDMHALGASEVALLRSPAMSGCSNVRLFGPAVVKVRRVVVLSFTYTKK